VYKYQDPMTPAGAGGQTVNQQKSLKAARWEAGRKQADDAVLRAHAFNHQFETSQKGDPIVKQALEGATIKFGTGGDWTFDTGIEWSNKKTLAAAIALGDQIGDSWRGIKQILQENGLADELIDIQAQDQNEKILRQLYGDEQYGNAALVGGAIGALAEPIGLLMPLGKAKSAYKAGLAAMAMGGLYGASLYVDENESRLTNAAITGALMGPLGYVASKYLSASVGDQVPRIIDDMKVAEEAQVYAQWSANAAKRAKAGGKNINKATPEIGARVRYEDVKDPISSASAFDRQRATDIVTKQADEARAWAQIAPDEPRGRMFTRAEKERAEAIVTRQAEALGVPTPGEIGQLGRPIPQIPKKVPKRAKPKKQPKPAQEIQDGIEARAATEGKRHAKVSQFRSVVNKVLQPVYDNVAQYSPKVAAKLRIADGAQHRMQHVWMEKVKPWQEFITKKLDKQSREQLKKLLTNGGFNKATMQYIQQVGGQEAVANAKKVAKVMDEILNNYKRVGYKTNHQSNYFPRAVADLEGLRERDIGILEGMYKRAAKRKGKALTAADKRHIDEHYFTFDTRYSRTSGSLNKRLKQDVMDDELAFYHNPEDALHYYIHTAAEDIAKRDFFKGFGYKPKSKDGLNPTGTDIDDSIQSIVEQIRKDVPSYAEQQEVIEALRSRFSADVHKTWRWVQNMKNLSYAGTLGNFWSAMTQFGDLVFAFHKYGIRSTVEALVGPKAVDRAHLGVEKAMAELQSTQKNMISTLADQAFKWSGFDKVDRFGKNVNINASLRQNIKLAKKDPAAFVKKWENHFGDETAGLMNTLTETKLKKNMMWDNDNVYLMLWNDLADTQPIGLSEMPIGYLKNPNGRIMYAYKTFALKQLNYMRNIITKEKNPVKKAYDLTYFATMFVMANSSIDSFKDFMAGKPLDINDKVTDNILSLFGTSKYAVDKTQGLGGIILQGLAPVPLTQGGKMLDKVSQGDVSPGDIVNQLPIVGKINKSYDIIP